MMLATSCSTSTPTQELAPLPAVTLVQETPAASQNGLPGTEAEVPRVTVDETVAAIQNGEAVLVDVRSPQAYQAGHIPGALSIPLGEIETNPQGLSLDKEQWIITYCT